jgi:hypothetical protein
MYRKVSLSIIDNFAIFGLSNYRFLLRKLSITHDNLIFQYLNKNTGISTKSIFFLKNSIFKKETNPMFEAGNVVKNVKSYENSSSYFNWTIVNSLNKNHWKVILGRLLNFYQYRKLTKIMPEIIVIDKKKLLSN